ncbi:MAG: polysulfide reductase NrfD [Chloroflexi bacterium]|nr:polysulfide reductase NrfD [Chloroflexota bacterium]
MSNWSIPAFLRAAPREPDPSPEAEPNAPREPAGAGFRRMRDLADLPTDLLVWLGLRPDEEAATAVQTPTYYGYPPVKGAVWKWYVPVYFFLGGLAAGSYLIGTLATLFGGREDRATVRWSRYLAMTAAALSPIPLIADLGRPERFHHMLRIVKWKSPMSMGTWNLTVMGLLSGVLAARQLAEDGWLPNWFGLRRRLLRLPARRLQAAGLVSAAFTGSYTGVLLSATATPFWARARLYLGPLFLTSGVTTTAAALSGLLALTGAPRGARERVAQVERMALLAELGISLAMLRALGPDRAPLVTGRIGRLYRWGALGLGVALPLVAHRPGRKHTRRQQVRLSLATLAGGFLLRYTVTEAGKLSARDPQASFRWTAAPPDRAR